MRRGNYFLLSRGADEKGAGRPASGCARVTRKGLLWLAGRLSSREQPRAAESSRARPLALPSIITVRGVALPTLPARPLAAGQLRARIHYTTTQGRKYLNGRKLAS